MVAWVIPIRSSVVSPRPWLTVDYAFAFSLINTQNVANKLAREAPARIRERYVPALMAGEIIGCTALTEPHAGSDASALRTTATRDGDSLCAQRCEAIHHQR